MGMWPLRRFRVEDNSMRPHLNPGDYMVVNRWAYRLRPPAAGDVVVLRDPEAPDRLLVKRVSQTLPNKEVLLAGDHAERSRDSRAFGSVPMERIVGKVWLRLRP